MSSKAVQNTVCYKDTLYTPSKCICIGRNYSDHIKEMGSERTKSIVVFNKPNSAITTELHAQHGEHTLHYETELCFLMINQKAAGIGLGFDLTKRSLQRELKDKGLPWEKSKAFNGSALFTDFVPISEDIDSLGFSLHIDGQLQQQGTVPEMLFHPNEIFKEMLSFQTFFNGDIVMSGTPAGVGEVEAGKEYKVTLYSGAQQLLTKSWVAV